MKKTAIVLGTFIILVTMITIMLVSIAVYAEGNINPSVNVVEQINKNHSRILIGESGNDNFFDTSASIAKIGESINLAEEPKTDTEISNEIATGADSNKNPDWEMIAYLTAIVGAGAFSGMGTGRSLTTETEESKVLGVKERLDNLENGIWIDEKDREKFVSEINKITARKYKVDELGYLIQDFSKPEDPKGSVKASDMIDSLIDSNKKIIVSTQNTFDRINPMNGEVNKIEINEGITIGSDSTGYAVFVSEKNAQGMVFLHELAHASEGDQNLAVDTENKIRSEIGMQLRPSENSTDGLFYDNYNEGEAYIDELASKTGATLSMDQKTGAIYSVLNGVTGQFTLNSNGTYIDPAANRLVVKEKEFKFQMNMDLAENEIYLRTEINKMGGTIDWVAAENKAVITINGKTINVKVGEYDTRIVNDRMVMNKTKLQELIEDADLGGNTDGQSGSSTTSQSIEQTPEDDFTSKTAPQSDGSNMSYQDESTDFGDMTYQDGQIDGSNMNYEDQMSNETFQQSDTTELSYQDDNTDFWN